ncbi:hypothetical protein [Kutzneria buriramensis]|uniref:hypothetical protein n=1 Tax=Kutzneria buriramensis TaxID=1045776 RepID=UPI0014769669|nr:hypothetical protein [Kutzneria buriramensis]
MSGHDGGSVSPRSRCRSTTGLPVGVQLVGAPWREDLLLQVSRELELAHPWAGRRADVEKLLAAPTTG